MPIVNGQLTDANEVRSLFSTIGANIVESNFINTSNTQSKFVHTKSGLGVIGSTNVLVQGTTFYPDNSAAKFNQNIETWNSGVAYRWNQNLGTYSSVGSVLSGIILTSEGDTVSSTGSIWGLGSPTSNNVFAVYGPAIRVNCGSLYTYASTAGLYGECRVIFGGSSVYYQYNNNSGTQSYSGLTVEAVRISSGLAIYRTQRQGTWSNWSQAEVGDGILMFQAACTAGQSGYGSGKITVLNIARISGTLPFEIQLSGTLPTTYDNKHPNLVLYHYSGGNIQNLNTSISLNNGANYTTNIPAGSWAYVNPSGLNMRIKLIGSPFYGPGSYGAPAFDNIGAIF